MLWDENKNHHQQPVWPSHAWIVGTEAVILPSNWRHKGRQDRHKYLQLSNDLSDNFLKPQVINLPCPGDKWHSNAKQPSVSTLLARVLICTEVEDGITLETVSRGINEQVQQFSRDHVWLIGVRLCVSEKSTSREVKGTAYRSQGQDWVTDLRKTKHSSAALKPPSF